MKAVIVATVQAPDITNWVTAIATAAIRHWFPNIAGDGHRPGPLTVLVFT